MDPFIGQIICVGFNFAPPGWAQCNGQLLPINLNQALFALLGTTYGGDGRTTFGLPDLRGRVAIGVGAGPGLPTITQGQLSGAPAVTLTTAQMPAHQHAAGAVTVNVTAGSVDVPVNTDGGGGNSTDPTKILSADGATGSFTSDAANGKYSGGSLPVKGAQVTATAAPTAVTGASQPVSIMQPSLGMNYIIATQGIFPSRQ